MQNFTTARDGEQCWLLEECPPRFASRSTAMSELFGHFGLISNTALYSQRTWTSLLAEGVDTERAHVNPAHARLQFRHSRDRERRGRLNTGPARAKHTQGLLSCGDMQPHAQL
jgi:hypothetical protein